MKSWKCNYFVNPLLLLLQKLLACWKELVLMYSKYYINWLDFLLDYPQIVLDIKNEPQCSLFFNFWRSTGLHTTVGTNYFKILKKNILLNLENQVWVIHNLLPRLSVFKADFQHLNARRGRSNMWSQFST